MQFKDVIGQEQISKCLIEGVHENRISHAQLFVGQMGYGMLPMALAYAQYVNCKNPGPTDSCGECPSCKRSQKMIHPDQHFVFPVIKNDAYKEPISDQFVSKWREMVLSNPYSSLGQWFKKINIENSQGQIYVYESDSIIRKLNLKSFESEYKIMIIWMAERMNTQCANKLLKMIEEPPPKTLLILIAENEEQILGTIRSRTQLVKFPQIEPQSMQQALSQNPLSEGKNINNLVHLSNGNYTKALELLTSNDDNHFYFEKFREIMRIIYKKEWLLFSKWSEEMAALGREKQKEFLIYGLKMIRECFVSNLQNPDIVYLNSEESAFSTGFASFINERNVLLFTKEFELAYRDISQNGNAKIIFFDFCIKLSRLLRL